MAGISFARPTAPSQPVVVAPTALPSPVTIEVQSTVVTEPVSGAQADSVVTSAPNTAVTPYVSPSQSPAVQAPALPPVKEVPKFADSDDNISFGDITLPGLNIAQGVGDLGQVFEPGTIVLGQKLELAGPPPRTQGKASEQVPISMVVLGFRPTRYTEVVQGGGLGRLYSSEIEVYNNGGTCNYDEKDKKPYFRPLATAMVLIEMPKNCKDPSMFPFEVDEPGDSEGKGVHRKFAVALWNLQGSGHTTAARPLKTWRKFRSFKDPAVTDPKIQSAYRNRWVSLTTVFKTFQNGNAAYTPVVTLGGYTSTEVRDTATEILG